MRAQTRRTEIFDQLTISGASTTQLSLQRETEVAGRGHLSGRFAREGETSPGSPTPTCRRRGSVPTETSVATAPDAFAETVQVYKAGDTGDGTTRSRVRISPSSPNRMRRLGFGPLADRRDCPHSANKKSLPFTYIGAGLRQRNQSFAKQYLWPFNSDRLDSL